MKKANSKAKKGTQADSNISTAADKTSSRSDNECSKSGAKLNANERNNRKDVPKVTSDRDLIESCFKCTLCSHLLNQPVSLACGHVFCSKCLSGYRDPAESSLKCPQCQVVHDLNAGSSLDSVTGSSGVHFLLVLEGPLGSEGSDNQKRFSMIHLCNCDNYASNFISKLFVEFI